MRIGIDIRNIGKKRTGDEMVFFHLVKHLALLDGVRDVPGKSSGGLLTSPAPTSYVGGKATEKGASEGLSSSIAENEYVLFLDDRSREEVERIAESLGVVGLKNFRFVTLGARNKFDWNLWVLPRYLRRHPVDVYHTQYILPFFVPSRIKIVTHVHDVSFCAYPEYIHWKDRLFLGLLIPRSLRRADKIVAVSEFTKAEIEKYYGVPPEKIAVVPNALGEDFENVRISDEQVRAVKEKYRLPSEFILYLGTLQPRKNVPALIGAYARMRERLPDIGLVLAGNRSGHNFDPKIDEVVRRHGLEGKVTFPGYVDQADLPALMRAAHVFAFPSLYEGFGIPLLEAMSQGVPVVASDIPCLREVGGEAVSYVPSQNLVEFSEILYNASIDSQLRERMVRDGLARIGRFSWRKSAERLRTLYGSLTG
jgi:glycosyltransferase involved in cell wall biosynthesis